MTSWWRHQMETFSALLAICAGNSPVPGEFPTQRPVTRSFDVFFDLCLNKRLSKQWWGWWFETLSRPLWRHRNVLAVIDIQTAGISLSIVFHHEQFTKPSKFNKFPSRVNRYPALRTRVGFRQNTFPRALYSFSKWCIVLQMSLKFIFGPPFTEMY